MIPSNNIFGLTHPHTSRCRILGYIMGHSRLLVRVSIPAIANIDADETLCLAFEDVLYYEGPMWWQGADFRVGTRDEQLSIFERMNKSEFGRIRTNDERALRKYRLFVLDSSNTRVRIVATMVFRAARCPEIYAESISVPFERIDIEPPSLTP